MHITRLGRAAIGLFGLTVSAQSVSPPDQQYILHFLPQSATYTTSLSVGTSFTMETWVSLDAASPYAVVMGEPNDPRGTDPYMNYVIGLDQLGTSFAFVQTTGHAGSYRQVTATSIAPLHTWTHVAAVLDSGTMELYINGHLVASGPSPGPPAGVGVPFALGGAIPDGTNLCCSYNGALRQARVWSRALSASEIQTYSAQTLVGSEPGLLADWPLDEGSGSPSDAGPQHLTLTLAGSVEWAHTALYDGGPYWDIHTFQTPDPGYGTGTVVDMDGNGLTAVTAYQHDVTIPGGAKAFRWGPGGFADVTSTVLTNPEISVLSPRDWTVADFNGDGKLDVFLASHGLDQAPYPGGQSHLFVQSADGKLGDETSSRLPEISNFTHTVAAADIDGDGDIDLYLGNIHGGTTGPQLYINDGSGHFTPRTTGLPDFVVNRNPAFTSARFVDVNNHGSPDLVLGSDQSSDTNVLLLNDGCGNFSAAPNPLPAKYGGRGWITIAIAPADYNGDGFTDLILVMTDNYQGHNALQLLLNNGDGTFRDASSQIPQSWTVVPATSGLLNGSWIQWVVPCDINGDGWIDFVTSGGNGLGQRLFINTGHGRFVDATETLPATGFNAQVLAGDFDGDGKVDLFFDLGSGNYVFARNLKPILPAQTTGPGLPKPAFTAADVTNAASSLSGSIAPGELVTVTGANLGPKPPRLSYQSDPTHISKSISGTRLLFNGVPAPLIVTSAGYLDGIVPYSVSGSSNTVMVQVEFNLMKSDPIQIPVAATAPGLFMQRPSDAGVILNQHGSLNTPLSPAPIDSIIVLFGTGEGQTSPPGVDGLLPTVALPTPSAAVTVTIGGLPAKVEYVGAAPLSAPGVFEIKVDVPVGVTPGDAVPVVVKIGGSISQSSYTMSVR